MELSYSYSSSNVSALKNQFSYYLHGLTVHSEIEFPELMPQPDGLPDVRISLGALSHVPIDQEHPWSNRFISPNQALLNIENAAKFLVSDGQEITIDPYLRADESAIRLYLLGSVMGCLLHQRRLLPLHANALQYEEECVLFTGHSGMGKSTLAAAMKNRGYKVLADDVCAVKICSGSKPLIYPGVPQIKLWKDAADHLEEDISLLKRIHPDEDKYAVPIGDAYCRQSRPIKSIYILNFHDSEDLKIADLALLEKLQAIKNYTYRKGMVAKMGSAEAHLKMCGELAETTRIRRILRPRNALLIDELIDVVEADLQ